MEIAYSLRGVNTKPLWVWLLQVVVVVGVVVAVAVVVVVMVVVVVVVVMTGGLWMTRAKLCLKIENVC